jgi:hypothetical protein
MEKNTTGRLIAATATESADIVYGSGFFAPDEYIYAEIGGEKYVFVSVLELARARQEVRPGINVVDSAEVLRKAPTDCKRCLVAAISRVYGVTHWQVPERFPLIYAKKLHAAGVSVEMADGSFFPERAIKRPDEIEKLRAAEAVTQEAQLQVRDFIAESTVNSQGFLEWHGKVLTCEFIRSEVEAEFKRKSYSSVGAIIACGLLQLWEFRGRTPDDPALAMAERILRTLASPEYLAAPRTNGGFLLKHSVGNIPGHSEVDVPLTYADYYFLEALTQYPVPATSLNNN